MTDYQGKLAAEDKELTEANAQIKDLVAANVQLRNERDMWKANYKSLLASHSELVGRVS